jgi:hypothetical protein
MNGVLHADVVCEWSVLHNVVVTTKVANMAITCVYQAQFA